MLVLLQSGYSYIQMDMEPYSDQDDRQAHLLHVESGSSQGLGASDFWLLLFSGLARKIVLHVSMG